MTWKLILQGPKRRCDAETVLRFAGCTQATKNGKFRFSSVDSRTLFHHLHRKKVEPSCSCAPCPHCGRSLFLTSLPLVATQMWYDCSLFRRLVADVHGTEPGSVSPTRHRVSFFSFKTIDSLSSYSTVWNGNTSIVTDFGSVWSPRAPFHSNGGPSFVGFSA